MYEDSQRSKQYTRDKCSENFEKIESKFKHMALITSKVKNRKWIIDYGSSSHISYDEKLFPDIDDTTKSKIIVANGNVLISY